jgi:precorrin-2 dehydrogenase / sirohydrochlorin ferrochelatase
MPGYPIELNVQDRTALVVGLGKVGRRKASGLIAAGASVIGVDPLGCPTDLPAGLDLRAEPYRSAHLRGAALAFAAGPARVNRRVVRDARRLGVWVNSASDPTASDFQIPAVWHDGLLTLTVSTAGASPALAAALRDRAAAVLGPAASGLVSLLAELRPAVLKRIPDRQARRQLMADWADPRWLDLWQRSGPDVVRREMLRKIEEHGK